MRQRYVLSESSGRSIELRFSSLRQLIYTLDARFFSYRRPYGLRRGVDCAACEVLRVCRPLLCHFHVRVSF